MFKKMLVVLFTLMLVASSANAGIITVRNWMNESDPAVKRNYARGIHEGIIASYLVTARSLKISQEKINACASAIDGFNKNFDDHTEATNAIVAYHLDNGGKTDALLSLVVSSVYLSNEQCRLAPKGREL